MGHALLLTGTVGSGKTTVAEALGDLLAEKRIPHAVVDVDWLRRSWPSPPADPFNGAITLRNLRAVARNFLAAGAERLILAGVVESRQERDAYREALGVPLAVGRLRVDLAIVRERLIRRHEHDPAGLEWHLKRSGELDRILDEAGVEDFVVDAGLRSPGEVAASISYP
ncbi:adenylyl-sulfate kinase [Actinoplanes sp. NPDC023714]|uniref:AAA family ATPase n=1 Tax=Actinoplanes sp. NPDC023714 TaxID=3154322 RepID=UPI00340FB6DB